MVTKSAYIRSLDCPRYAWLYQYSREAVADAVDPQRAWRMEQGNVVERYARQLFPDGILLRRFGTRAAKETERQVAQRAPCLFQATVMVDGLHAMADVFKKSPVNGSWDIYEVKSSTGVTDRQLHDVCFQKIAFERSGYTIGRVLIVHIDLAYVGNGDVDPSRLFVTVDVTRDVTKLFAVIRYNYRLSIDRGSKIQICRNHGWKLVDRFWSSRYVGELRALVLSVLLKFPIQKQSIDVVRIQ